MPRTFKGTFTGLTFDNLDSLIAQERAAALRQVPKETVEDKAFNSLAPEQQLALLKEGERQEQLKGKRADIQLAGDAWITLRPEYRDDTRSAKLMRMQLRANGVAEGEETIADFELAFRQLSEAGMLTLNKAPLEKQRVAEINKLAEQAVNTPGSIFDQTSEEAMYDENLPLDEIRRRANEQLSR